MVAVVKVRLLERRVSLDRLTSEIWAGQAAGASWWLWVRWCQSLRGADGSHVESSAVVAEVQQAHSLEM